MPSSSGGVAHMVERSLRMREARGSIPRTSIPFFSYIAARHWVPPASDGNRACGLDEPRAAGVASSSPLLSSTAASARPWLLLRLCALATSASAPLRSTPLPHSHACPPLRDCRPAAWPSHRAPRRGRQGGTWRRSRPGCPRTSRAPTRCSSPTPRAPSQPHWTTARHASRSSSRKLYFQSSARHRTYRIRYLLLSYQPFFSCSLFHGCF
jgi:hypothetical protein